MDYMNRQEIVEKLKLHFGLPSDSALGEFLGINRQRVHRFKSGKQEDINTIIITRLFDEIDKGDNGA